jgi:hypothetical protein
MEILTAGTGFCLGITRAYREMNERARNEAPFAVAHQNAGGDYDTLARIEGRDPDLLDLYPALGKVSVARDVSKLGQGDRLVLESDSKLHQGLHSFRNMRRMDASFKNARALRLRFSQSLARRRQRLSHAMVRSTIQRLGNCTNPLAWSERLTISISR